MIKIFKEGNYIQLLDGDDIHLSSGAVNDIKIVPINDDEYRIYGLIGANITILNISSLYDKEGVKYSQEDFNTWYKENTGFNSPNSGATFIPLTGTEEGKPVTGNIEFSYPDDGSNYGELCIDLQSDTIAIIKSDGKYNIDTQNYTGTNAGGFIQMIDGNQRSIYISNSGLSDSEIMNPLLDIDYIQKHYIDKANSYSTTETLTGGTWIDGKPIYRKVYTVITDGTTENIIDLTTLNIEKFIDKKGYIDDGSGDIYKVGENSTSVFVKTSLTNVTFTNNDDNDIILPPDITIGLIIEYIKNTD
jgi:hypothetical protein